MARIKHALPDLKEARNRRKEETKRRAYELCKEYENIGVGKTYHIFTSKEFLWATKDIFIF